MAGRGCPTCYPEESLTKYLLMAGTPNDKTLDDMCPPVQLAESNQIRLVRLARIHPAFPNVLRT